PAAAASLLGRPVAEARPLLAELAAAHLLTEPAPGRYGWHDLLRAYARRLFRAAGRPAALRRLFDHYLHTAFAAERLLLPYRDPIDPAPPARGAAVVPPADTDAATAWLAANRPALLAAVDAAAEAGLDVHAWQLAWSLTTFLHRQGRWDELAHALTTALDAGQRLGDRLAQAHLHRELALALCQLGRHDEASAHLRRAGRLFSAAADRIGQAGTLLYLGWLSEQRGDRRAALEHDEHALALFTAAGHKAGQARALNAVGWDHAQLGEHDRAVERCREALDLHQALGNGPGEARAWDSLGYALHHLARHDEALTCFGHALELYRRDDDRYCEAETLTHAGDTQLAAGRTDAAREAWQAALRILDTLGHPDAADVRARLS
ncbi:tetratricopeptide repeat protein, partial [Dactylosporangium sp. NPDC005572]|uniref:tetratricopeptide repeat protein n=1 Tax=Dactylosporangium sp. NPDC005572 TaxID=3156889 RepID=UPI0033B5176F